MKTLKGKVNYPMNFTGPTDKSIWRVFWESSPAMRSLVLLFHFILMSLVCPFDSGAHQRMQGFSAIFQALLKSAEQGNADAQYGLGVVYARGLGVPQDYAEAAKWFRSAAEKGNHIAQRLLGLMLAEGLGVKKDYVDAYKWSTLSIAGSVDKQNPLFQRAIDSRDSLAKQRTDQQIEDAEKLAKEWKRLPTQAPLTPMAVDGNLQQSKLIWTINPVYPDKAKQQRVTGKVILSVIAAMPFDASGVVLKESHENDLRKSDRDAKLEADIKAKAERLGLGTEIKIVARSSPPIFLRGIIENISVESLGLRKETKSGKSNLVKLVH